jgi:hypothetical protein
LHESLLRVCEFPFHFIISIFKEQKLLSLMKTTYIFFLYHVFGITSKKILLGTVAHSYVSSYSGGRDQREAGLRPTWANSSRQPILKILNTKKDCWSVSSGRAFS